MGKRLGIWIPLGIMEIKNLDWGDKILLTEILSLHQTKHGCIASNQYFGSILGMTSGAASKRISRLIKSGFIKTKNIYRNGGCVGRIITPEKSLNETYLSKNEFSVGKTTPELDDKDSSEGCRVESMNGLDKVEPQDSTSESTLTVLSQQPGGTSLTIPEVLLNRPGSSSAENTINTDIKKEKILVEKGPRDIEPIFASNTGSSYSNVEDGNGAEERWIKSSGSLKVMNCWFNDYPNWQIDLEEMGLQKFIQKTKTYHHGNSDYIKLITDFWNR